MEIYQNKQLTDLPNEVWKPVLGYDGLLASNLGRIKALPRIYFIGKNPQVTKKRIVSQIILKKRGKNGYLISKYSTTKTLLAHRAVALAFLPNPLNKPQVNHIDGNKRNNHVDNLEWCTADENYIHAVLNKKNTLPLGNKPKKEPKPNLYVYLETGELFKTYLKIEDAAKELNISKYSIPNNYNKHFLGFVFSRTKLTEMPPPPIEIPLKPRNPNFTCVYYTKKQPQDNKLNLIKKKVSSVNMFTGIETIYDSISEAARQVNSKSKHIAKALKNKYSHRGYKWFFE